MTWVVWRQHRTQLCSGAAVLTVLTLFLLWTHHAMNGYLHSSGLSACLAGNSDCAAIEVAFNDKYRTLLNNAGYFNFLPLVVGLFWGAPLVAREFEQGTYRLAWTQTVTRRRWFLVRIVALLAVAIMAAWAFGTLLSWWFHGFAQVPVKVSGGGDTYTRMSPEVYDFNGLAPVGYTVYALALGVAAGVLFRRTLVAMAVTVAGWLPLRLWIESIRGHLVGPLHVTYPAFGVSPRAGHGDWVLTSSLVDSAQRAVTDGPVTGPCASAPNKRSLTDCLTAHGFHQIDTYQPASRFWTLQGIEFGVFAGLAVLLLVFAYYWVTHRSSG